LLWICSITAAELLLAKIAESNLVTSRLGTITRMQVFREAKLRRAHRQLATISRAVRAGRSRAKSREATKPVNGAALLQLLSTVADDVQLIQVPVKRPPWTSTSIHADVGDRITWLAWGHVDLLKPLGVAVGPSMGLLCRVGNGNPVASGRSTRTFTAACGGVVQVAGRAPGWVQDDGSIVVDRVPYRLPYRAVTGMLSAIVVRWPPRADPREALASVASRDQSGLCGAEAARLANPPQPPPGWNPLPATGEEEIWAPADRGVRLDCNDNVGIIRHPVDAPLTSTLRLRWSWRIDELPSQLPEDTKITHDYLSIALQFDDGQDLTWYWSSALPEGFSYRCPLDYWRKVETHIVVHSGPPNVGSWVNEDRGVLADHQAAIGGPAPARVVNAWLIGVSLFQGGRARGEFRNIELVDVDTVLRIG
jgi:hypothetical protein